MAITLADAQKNTQDDVQFAVIDEFRKSSWLLDNLTFDDCVNPSGGGATLTYGYTRLITERGADFRAIGSEYTASDAHRERYTVDLKPLGGSFEIDRVLADLGPAASNEVSFQMSQLIKSTQARFADEFINGDTGSDPNGFDGLDVALAGSSTELTPGGAQMYADWTATGITDEATAQTALEMLDTLLSLLDGDPSAILTNRHGRLRMIAIARRAGYYTRSEDAFGRPIDGYAGIPIIDMGAKPASSNPIIPIETRDPDGGGEGGNITGLTDIYAVRLGLDGVHGVSVTGSPLVRTWMPDFTTSGAVKTGEAEMGPCAIVLKATKAAAVLRNVKVQ